MTNPHHLERMIARGLVFATFLLGGCSALPQDTNSTATSSSSSSAASSETMPTSVADAMSRNLTPWVADAPGPMVATVDLSHPSGDGVSVNDDVITLSKTGSYTLSGSWTGQVVVDPGGGQVDIFLDGASIASPRPGALVIEDADVAVIHMGDGSENQLSDAGVSTEDENNPVEAALYSHATLLLTGEGNLTVTSTDQDAIASKDGLVIDSGTYTISAGDDGIRGKDYLDVSGGSLDIDSTGDGLKSTNSSDATAGYVWVSGGQVSATSGDDCIDAQTDALISGGTLALSCADDGIHAEMATVVDDGALTISASTEGVEGFFIHLAGGIINVTSSDDGINASGGSEQDAPEPGTAPTPGSLPDREPSGTDSGMPNAGNRPPGGLGGGRGPGNNGGPPGGFGGEGDGGQMLLISGGNITINAEGDGLDSNGSGSMTGGTVTVYGPTRPGNGALDVNTGLVVTGGTLFAGDSGSMSTTPAVSSSQAWLCVHTPAGDTSTISIVDSSGSAMGTYTLPKTASTLVFSASELVSGDTYTVIVNGEPVAEATAS